MKLYFSLG